MLLDPSALPQSSSSAAPGSVVTAFVLHRLGHCDAVLADLPASSMAPFYVTACCTARGGSSTT